MISFKKYFEAFSYPKEWDKFDIMAFNGLVDDAFVEKQYLEHKYKIKIPKIENYYSIISNIIKDFKDFTKGKNQYKTGYNDRTIGEWIYSEIIIGGNSNLFTYWDENVKPNEKFDNKKLVKRLSKELGLKRTLLQMLIDAFNEFNMSSKLEKANIKANQIKNKEVDKIKNFLKQQIDDGKINFEEVPIK